MGTQQGLLERGNAYYFQARIPKDVLPYFPEGTKPLIRERVGSMAELSKVQAKAIVQEKLADLSARIHLGRTTGNIHKQIITDQEIQYLIERAIHQRIRNDEKIRDSGINDPEFTQQIQDIKAEVADREKSAIAARLGNLKAETQNILSI